MTVAPARHPDPVPTPRAGASRPDAVARGGILAVLLGALVLRIHHLGTRSLWTDEGSTWTAATSSLRELVRLCAQKDASPPLFYLLTAAAVRIDDGEAMLRMVSVIASVTLVWLTYRLARMAAGRAESTLAAALVALSPFQVMYAQEARTYALVGCLAVAAFTLFLRALRKGTAGSFAAYIVVSALGFYTQSIAVLGTGVQGALVLFTPEGRRRLPQWFLSQLAIVALYLPWLFVSLSQMSRLSSSHWYLEPPGRAEMFHVFRAILVSPLPLVTAPAGAELPGLDAWIPRGLGQVVLLLIPLLPLAAALPSLAARGWSGFHARAMAAALVLPPLAVLVASSRVPLFLPRYFVLLTPFLAILTARGLMLLRPVALRWVWTALMLLVLAFGLVLYDYNFTKEPWRRATRFIAATSANGRVAVLVPFDVDPFRFYNRRLAHPLQAFEVSHPAVPFASEYTPQQLADMERVAAERTRGYDEVWVVVRSPNSPVRRQVALRAERAASQGRTFAGRWRWDATNGPIRVVRYVTPAAP